MSSEKKVNTPEFWSPTDDVEVDNMGISSRFHDVLLSDK